MDNHQSTQSLSQPLWKSCSQHKTSSMDVSLKVAGLENSPPTPPANFSAGRLLFTYSLRTYIGTGRCETEMGICEPRGGPSVSRSTQILVVSCVAYSCSRPSRKIRILRIGTSNLTQN